MIGATEKRIGYEWSPVNATRRTQNYYQSRKPTGDYQNYWGKITDPDGVVRDRTQEREQYLEDIADEVAFFWDHDFCNVADVGAGLGWFLEAIGPRTVGRTAVEISPQAIEVLEEIIPTVINDVCDLPTHSYQAIFCHHVIEHVVDPVGMLHHIRRALVGGGWLVIATPDFASPCAKRFGENYRLLKDPTHVSLFSNESMHRLLTDHGFTIHDVRYPFPERYATAENFARWNDPTKVSPAWPGNFLTFYATRG